MSAGLDRGLRRKPVRLDLWLTWRTYVWHRLLHVGPNWCSRSRLGQFYHMDIASTKGCPDRDGGMPS